MNYRAKYRMRLACLIALPDIINGSSMLKKRYFSANSDFKTGFLCKLTLFLGILLLIVFIFLKVSSFMIEKESEGFLGQIYELTQTTIPDSILAFSIIFLGVGIILYFFHCQFAKLAKIADEIENEEELD